MPTFANLTINDGQTTPVARTFNAQSQAPLGVFNWQETTAANPLGYIRLAMSLKFPSIGARVSLSDRVYRVMLKVHVPTMESTSAATGSGIPPAPTVAYTTSGTVEYVIPERATLQERKDLNAYIKNALALSAWTDQAVNLLSYN